MNDKIAEMGKRGPVICGKVPQKLYDAARDLIDGVEFKTMNDVVEEAIWHFVMNMKREGDEGGTSLGN